MTGIFQLADLTIQVEGSIEELVEAQGVAREFSRACRKIREAAGDADVQILVDKDLESEEGRKFSKIRLRAYANGKNYTIDCGSGGESVLGVFVEWDAPVEVYDRETEEVEEVYPLQGDSPSNQSRGASSDSPQEAADEPESGSSKGMEIPSQLDAEDPPTPTTTGEGKITEEAATVLWSAANQSGHTKKSFARMLASVAGIQNPKLLHPDDWAKAWEYAVDPATWKMDEHIEEARELPLDE